ncbi:MAG: DMT family transporter [Muribaculaceae bacterium]|nr:DMT family transporter [Muribaculaceae bacterium]
MDKSKFQGHAAVILANTVFGLSVPVTNDLVNNHFTPNGYMFFRCLGATLIFWLLAAFLPKEKVERKDLYIIIVGGMVGFAISQTFAAWALAFTQPVYFSLLATLTPIAVMLLAAMFINEKITGLKAVGVFIGIAGAMLMVFMGWKAGTGKNDLLGISLALLSLLTWAIYLVITGKVSAKYSAVTQMKWVFLASTIIVIPFGWMMSGIFGDGPVNYSELMAQPLYAEPSMLWGIVEMAFVILFATVLGFFFIPYAMARIPATTVSVYTNLQPVVASIVAFAIGQDVLTWDKPVAGVLVLLSAYIVTVAATKHQQ